MYTIVANEMPVALIPNIPVAKIQRSLAHRSNMRCYSDLKCIDAGCVHVDCSDLGYSGENGVRFLPDPSMYYIQVWMSESQEPEISSFRLSSIYIIYLDWLLITLCYIIFFGGGVASDQKWLNDVHIFESILYHTIWFTVQYHLEFNVPLRVPAFDACVIVCCTAVVLPNFLYYWSLSQQVLKLCWQAFCLITCTSWNSSLG